MGVSPMIIRVTGILPALSTSPRLPCRGHLARVLKPPPCAIHCLRNLSPNAKPIPTAPSPLLGSDGRFEPHPPTQHRQFLRFPPQLLPLTPVSRPACLTFPVSRASCLAFPVSRPACLAFPVSRPACLAFPVSRASCLAFPVSRPACLTFPVSRASCPRIKYTVAQRHLILTSDY